MKYQQKLIVIENQKHLLSNLSIGFLMYPLHLLRTTVESHQYDGSIFFFFINVVNVNAWTLYKRSKNKKQNLNSIKLKRVWFYRNLTIKIEDCLPETSSYTRFRKLFLDAAMWWWQKIYIPFRCIEANISTISNVTMRESRICIFLFWRMFLKNEMLRCKPIAKSDRMIEQIKTACENE